MLQPTTPAEACLMAWRMVSEESPCSCFPLIMSYWCGVLESKTIFEVKFFMNVRRPCVGCLTTMEDILGIHIAQKWRILQIMDARAHLTSVERIEERKAVVYSRN